MILGINQSRLACPRSVTLLLDVDSVALSSGFDLPVTFDITPLNDRAFVLKLPDQAQILDTAEESGLAGCYRWGCPV